MYNCVVQVDASDRFRSLVNLLLRVDPIPVFLIHDVTVYGIHVPEPGQCGHDLRGRTGRCREGHPQIAVRVGGPLYGTIVVRISGCFVPQT